MGQQATLDVMVAIGPTKQTVTAVAGAEFLKTSDASEGEVVDLPAVAQVPLNGKRPVLDGR